MIAGSAIAAAPVAAQSGGAAPPAGPTRWYSSHAVVLSLSIDPNSLSVAHSLSAAPDGLSAVVLLSAAPEVLCSPAGLGTTAALSGTLQHGISYAAGLATVGNVGGGGSAAALASPLRVAGGGAQSATALLSIAGAQQSMSLAQPSPFTLAAGTGTISAPLSLANPAVMVAPYSVIITADGRDITRQVSECTIASSESALFDTINLSLPDGSAWPLNHPPAEIIVTLADATYTFMVEEFAGEGPTRTIWGRPPSARSAEPWSDAAVWNERISAAVSASALAADIALATWTAADFPTPPRWELDGTPAEALQKLAAAAGGLVVAAANTDSITVRRRWPVRPIDMNAADVVISRETALDMNISEASTPKYGSVIVQGWSTDSMLPKFSVEGNPILGQPAYLRLYWQGDDHPSINKWITDGNAWLLTTNTETVTETIVFTDGSASVAWPIWDFVDFEWLGFDYGDIIWLENGYSTDLELSTPGHGVARVTYRTRYERWLLSGQAVETVLFGVDVSEGAVAVKVQFSSGGAEAGEVKEPLLGSVSACVEHGTALLDDSKIRYTLKATLPRTAHLSTGQIAWVEDELTGVSGFGKIKSVETKITSSRITQSIEVAVC